HLPHATSLRMGRLGYQSDAQSALAVSYNSLKGYAASLHQALTQAYPAYDAIGLRDEHGHYKQLSTSLLQIENEFYSTIRPKRVIQSGERPLHALRERGVEYVEVRCMDLNPFLPVGIDAATIRFLDVFLLHCLLLPSPADTPDEIAALARNQQAVAARGREPGLRLERLGDHMALVDWAQEILTECVPIAQTLDRLQGSQANLDAVHMASRRMQDFSLMPSAQVLQAMQPFKQRGHTGFTLARSEQNRTAMMAQDWPASAHQRFVQEARVSMQEQIQIESADTRSFEAFRQDYLSPQHLVV
ncbi:MAG TPA: glutamate--cysteine ligase, partial [Aquabacterium sp.]|nr:glutamate--cysteine ligase [Aquabacterium sp.]